MVCGRRKLLGHFAAPRDIPVCSICVQYMVNLGAISEFACSMCVQCVLNSCSIWIQSDNRCTICAEFVPAVHAVPAVLALPAVPDVPDVPALPVGYL